MDRPIYATLLRASPHHGGAAFPSQKPEDGSREAKTPAGDPDDRIRRKGKAPVPAEHGAAPRRTRHSQPPPQHLSLASALARSSSEHSARPRTAPGAFGSAEADGPDDSFGHQAIALAPRLVRGQSDHVASGRQRDPFPRKPVARAGRIGLLLFEQSGSDLVALLGQTGVPATSRMQEPASRREITRRSEKGRVSSRAQKRY